MKKFLVVLLSLGLIVAFGATASALDVKFSGQYYVAGQYESNRSLNSTDRGTALADIWQRARVQTTFVIAEGLSFTTRFDALEKMWGGIGMSTTSQFDRSNSRSQVTSTVTQSSPAAQENFEMEQAYVNFKTGVGTFQVGYQDAEVWGTGFGDTPNSRPRIVFYNNIGPVTITGVFEKGYDSVNASTATNIATVDGDVDKYMLNGVYRGKGLEVGLLYVYANAGYYRTTALAGAAAADGTATTFRINQHTLSPYMKGTFGPVYVEGELIYFFGNAREYDVAPAAGNRVATGWGGYALAKVNVGPAYFGASIGYSTGDDPDTLDKDESGPKSSTNWNPGILFGDGNYRTWIGASNLGMSNNGTNFDASAKQNLLAYNLFAGFNPTPKLNLDAQLWILQADVDKYWDAFGVRRVAVSKNYGVEFDVTATYKIYDNLSYMVGAGYFWTGDYFKGTSATNTVSNDYVLLNKLTLTF